VGWYFEEFEVGQKFETAALSITREMVLGFAELTGDDNPLHTDLEFMRQSPAGDVIAHGLLIEAVAVGLIARLGIMGGTTMALAEASCRFLKPVLPGDTIRVVMTIDGMRETSKPDRGLLIRKVEVINQRDEVVVESALVSLMRRRGATTAIALARDSDEA
jgi:acyl dehydratase